MSAEAGPLLMLAGLAMIGALWKPVQQRVAVATFRGQAGNDQAARNRAAFLAMIRYAEGTSGQDGYAAMFGHTPARPRLFESFTDHPRVASQFTDQVGRKLWTSAAGAYQFMAVSPIPTGGSTKVDTWDRVQRALGLPDFSPASQDLAALFLVHEAGALGLVDAGRFDEAVSKVRRVWASMPGAGYAQRERSITALRNVYTDSGGNIA